MGTSRTQQTVVDFLKQQRLVWSCALIVGLFLVLVGHIPVFPVLAGCAFAIVISVLRTKYNFTRTNGLPSRR